jgi:hypothetical protein
VRVARGSGTGLIFLANRRRFTTKRKPGRPPGGDDQPKDRTMGSHVGTYRNGRHAGSLAGTVGRRALRGRDLIRVVESDPTLDDQAFETLREVLRVALCLGELRRWFAWASS